MGERKKSCLRSVQVGECGQVGGRVAGAAVWLVGTAPCTVWETGLFLSRLGINDLYGWTYLQSMAGEGGPILCCLSRTQFNTNNTIHQSRG